MVGGNQGGAVFAERFSLITAIDVPPIDFGDQTVGLNGTQLIPVRNIGQVPLFVTAASVQGPAASDYTIRYDRWHRHGRGGTGRYLSGDGQLRARRSRHTTRRSSWSTPPGSSSTIPLTGPASRARPG